MAQSVAQKECVTFIGVGGMKLSEWRKYRQILLENSGYHDGGQQSCRPFEKKSTAFIYQ